MTTLMCFSASLVRKCISHSYVPVLWVEAVEEPWVVLLLVCTVIQWYWSHCYPVVTGHTVTQHWRGCASVMVQQCASTGGFCWSTESLEVFPDWLSQPDWVSWLPVNHPVDGPLDDSDGFNLSWCFFFYCCLCVWVCVVSIGICATPAIIIFPLMVKKHKYKWNHISVKLSERDHEHNPVVFWYWIQQCSLLFTNLHVFLLEQHRNQLHAHICFYV